MLQLIHDAPLLWAKPCSANMTPHRRNLVSVLEMNSRQEKRKQRRSIGPMNVFLRVQACNKWSETVFEG
jgi:hypothetical protein